MAELFTLMAARYDHTKRKIIPALQDGKVVLCDRYSDSTFAYQVFGKGIEYYTVARFNKVATLGIKPKLTLLVDVPVDVALRRLAEKGKLDHYESLDRSFFERVRYGYLALAKRAKRRIKVLDGRIPRAFPAKKEKHLQDSPLKRASHLKVRQKEVRVLPGSGCQSYAGWESGDPVRRGEGHKLHSSG